VPRERLRDGLPEESELNVAFEQSARLHGLTVFAGLGSFSPRANFGGRILMRRTHDRRTLDR
jgi:hypothetical protein